MSEKRIDTLIWGTVITNGKKYYLLEPTPEKSRKVWQLEGTVCWQVTEEDNYILENSITPVYKASKLIFGRSAVVELFENPTVTKIVEYYFADENSDEILGSPV